MAFVAATPLTFSRTTFASTSAVISRKPVTPSRRTAVMQIDNRPELEKIPQGFTAFSEQLNGRAAMIGFLLAVVTEAITGKGILGQLGSIFDIVNLASAFGN